LLTYTLLRPVASWAVCTTRLAALGPLLLVVRARVMRSPVTLVVGPLRLVARSKLGLRARAIVWRLLAVWPASLLVVLALAVAITGPLAGASKVITDTVLPPLARAVRPA
jgi:hypothetical protein